MEIVLRIGQGIVGIEILVAEKLLSVMEKYLEFCILQWMQLSAFFSVTDLNKFGCHILYYVWEYRFWPKIPSLQNVKF